MNSALNEKKKFSVPKIAWTILALLVILGIVLAMKPSFFSITVKEGHLYGSLIDVIKSVSQLALIAIGMTLVIATGGIDISVGSTMAVSAAIACSFLESRGIFGFNGLNDNFIAAIGIPLVIGAIFGLWNGFLIAKIKIQPVVATLILMVAGRGLAQLITEGKIVIVSKSATHYDSFYYLANGYLLGVPFSIFIVLAIFAVIMLLSKFTAFGLFLESAGINSKSSRLSGVAVDRIKLIVYALCGFLAAISGLIYSSNTVSADAAYCGMFIEMDGILAVAIGGGNLNGGKFNLTSSVIGAVIITTLQVAIRSVGVPSQLIYLVKAIAVIIICLLQSENLRRRIVAIFSLKKGKGVVAA